MVMPGDGRRPGWAPPPYRPQKPVDWREGAREAGQVLGYVAAFFAVMFVGAVLVESAVDIANGAKRAVKAATRTVGSASDVVADWWRRD